MISLLGFTIFIPIIAMLMVYYLYLNFANKKTSMDLSKVFYIIIYLYFGWVLYDNINGNSAADIIDIIFEPVIYFTFVLAILRIIESKYLKRTVKGKL